MPCAQIDLRFEFDSLPRHKFQFEATRQGCHMGMHFHQGKMLADTCARAKSEWEVREAIPVFTRFGEKAIGSKARRIGPMRGMPLYQIR